MKPLPVWFERTENLAVAAAVVVAFVSSHFSWWWLPALFLAFDASMVGYLAGNRAGAVCYNLAHAYVVPAVLLLSYVATGTRWCAFVGLLWAFHIAGDRVLGYGLKFTSGFQDTHLGTIGKQRLPRKVGICWRVIRAAAGSPAGGLAGGTGVSRFRSVAAGARGGTDRAARAHVSPARTAATPAKTANVPGLPSAALSPSAA